MLLLVCCCFFVLFFFFFLLLLVYLFLEVFQLFILLGKVLVHFLKCFGGSVLTTLIGVF